MDPYTSIGEKIESWCNENFYDDFIVTILIDGDPCTTLYRYDYHSDSFYWEDDWYEGQKEVSLLGFTPISMCIIIGYPEKE